MCGSGKLGSIEAQQQQTANTLSADFNKVFAGNQNILAQIAPSLEGIITKGVGQYGFTPEEDAARKSEILATNQAATRQASNIAGGELAAQGGGTTSLPSGSKEAIMGGIAERGAQAGASALQQETAQGYETGRANYFGATQELPQVASTLESAGTGLESLAQGSESEAGQTEQQRLNATRAWIAPVTSLATAAMGAGGQIGAAALKPPTG